MGLAGRNEICFFEGTAVALYTTIHLHNVGDDALERYAAWFDAEHRQAVNQLRGFKTMDRYEVTQEQIMADIPQPWRFMSVYDFDIDDAQIDVPALAPLIASARDAGWIAKDDTERLFTYELYSDWVGSPNWQVEKPLSGISIILANYTPGRFEEYQRWYDEVHGPEVSNVPGHVAMKRGRLADVQVPPVRYCPGDQLVMTAQQTDNLAFTIGDFGARAMGRSPSGINMAPRSSAGSLARTVHYFRKISGLEFWSDGVAYGGDLSVYHAND